MEFSAKGVEEGATLVYGGKQVDRPGLYFEPTIFTNVKDEHFIAKEESFGPIMIISKFQDEFVYKLIVRIFRTVNRKSIEHPSIECRALSKSRMYCIEYHYFV